jgi:hypothetical protein
MSSREHGRGSGRNRAPDSAVLATISSADAMVAGEQERATWERRRGVGVVARGRGLYFVPTENTASRAV